MIQVLRNASFRFMWDTKWYFIVFSALALAVAVGAIVTRGFNYGIDFAGGTAVQVKFRETPEVDRIRAALESAGLGDVSIQRIGDPKDHEILIRVESEPGQARQEAGRATSEGGERSSEIIKAVRSLDPASASAGLDLNMASEAELTDWLAARLQPAGAAAPGSDVRTRAASIASAIIAYRNEHAGILESVAEVAGIPGVPAEAAQLLQAQAAAGPIALRSIEFVGPTAGRELLRNTIYAILGCSLGILVYVWFRFHRWTWGLASIAALVHDVTIAAGAMALTQKEFSLPVVAALLTILGYSINDTIVIFDRIRENLRIYRDHDFEEVVNASVNQTLSRSVLTSFTVFVAVTALYLYGGDKLEPLSFCLMIGVIFGSYSTIFVAAALLVIAYHSLGSKAVKA